MKLEKTLSKFVLEQNTRFSNKEIDINELQASILRYTLFLTQELNIGMFVPAVFKDGEWVVLEEPKTPHTFASENSDRYIVKWNEEKQIYQEAKERVLFKNAKLVPFEIHKINTLSGTIFLQIKDFVLGHKKEWEEFFCFYFDSIEEILSDESFEDIELELTETGEKQLKGEL